MSTSQDMQTIQDLFRISEPLKTCGHWLVRSKKLVRKSATCLVLKPSPEIRIKAGLPASIGAVAIAGATAILYALPEQHDLGRFLLIAGALWLVPAGLGLLLPQKYTFDLSSGEMTVRPRLTAADKALRLTDIVAVQVTTLGPQRFVRSTSSDIHYVAYQLNLVVADPAHRRMNLTEDPDLECIRRNGLIISEFLRVPMIDQVTQAILG